MMVPPLVSGQGAPPVDSGVLGRRRVADRVGQPGWLVMYVFVNETQGATVVSTLLYLTHRPRCCGSS